MAPDDLTAELERIRADAEGDAVTEHARQRTAELFAASDDENWLGI